jgi:undecaprenyl-diphosphatase
MVTGLGDRRALAAMTGAATVAALARHRLGVEAAVTPLAAVVVPSLARWGLSRAIGRERPPQNGWLVSVDGPSFPSRHATAATLGALALYRALPRSGMVAWPLAAMVAAVGLSRVRLGVHWPTDVVAGIAFAAFTSSIVDAAASSMAGHRRHWPEGDGAGTTR